MPIRADAADKRHPIQVVARRTGLTADVLRVWEKRYRVVTPARTRGGHRLYSDDDVDRLLLLQRATAVGRRISSLADLPTQQLLELVHEDDRAATHLRAEQGTAAAPSTSDHLEACLEALEAMDVRALEASLMRAAVALAAQDLIERVLSPLLEHIGESWARGRIRPGHEHLATAVIRRVLESLASAAMPGPGAPALVVATPAGQLHEFGALFVAAAAATMGWRVTYLGTDLPAVEIADVGARTGAAAIAVSLVYPENDPGVKTELRALRQAAGPNTPILVGGRAAPSYREAIGEMDARLVMGVQELREALEALG